MSTFLRTSAVVVVTLLVLAWVVVRPDAWLVERVEFEGHERATEAQLRHLADLRNGTSVWGVDLAAVSAGVARHPWVARAEATRRFPTTVVVRVTEHEPVALLAFEDALYYVDSQGTPFLQATSDDLDHVVLAGIDRDLEEAHPDLPRLVIRDALWLLDELDGRELLPRERVSDLQFHRTRGFTVRAVGAGPGHRSAEILLGFDDYDLQLRRLAALLDRGVDLSQPLHVDLAPAKVAIVRPQDDALLASTSRAPFLAP